MRKTESERYVGVRGDRGGTGCATREPRANVEGPESSTVWPRITTARCRDCEVSGTSAADPDPSGAQHLPRVTAAPQSLCIAAQHAFRASLTSAVNATDVEDAKTVNASTAAMSRPAVTFRAIDVQPIFAP